MTASNINPGKSLSGKAKSDQHLLNIGFGSTLVAERVVAILSPNSAPMKRLKDDAKEDQRLVDATHGRRTRSIIVLDSNHIVLSAIQAETVSHRYEALTEHNKKNKDAVKVLLDNEQD